MYTAGTRLLDKLFYGDMTAAISTNVSSVLEYKRGKTNMREYCNEFRNRFQVLDQRGESIPTRTRGHLLLSNAGLTEDQKAVVVATTGRDLSFDAISDALNLLYPTASTSVEIQSSYWGSHAENRGKGGPGGGYRGQHANGKGKGKGNRFPGNCHNCGTQGHKFADCTRPGGGAHGKQTNQFKQFQQQAMVAEATPVRGKTLTMEERMNQLEDFLTSVNFSGLVTEAVMFSLKCEGLEDAAIIDPGCTSNVCSEGWLKTFETKMGRTFKKTMLKDLGESRKTFVFGAGAPMEEIYRVSLELTMFGQQVIVQVSVVEGTQAPFLLSRQQLSEWKALLDIEGNSIQLTIKGKTVNYLCPTTSTNLMVLPLNGVEQLDPSEGH